MYEFIVGPSGIGFELKTSVLVTLPVFSCCERLGDGSNSVGDGDVIDVIQDIIKTSLQKELPFSTVQSTPG